MARSETRLLPPVDQINHKGLLADTSFPLKGRLGIILSIEKPFEVFPDNLRGWSRQRLRCFPAQRHPRVKAFPAPGSGVPIWDTAFKALDTEGCH